MSITFGSNMITVGVVTVLAVVSPGPDFAVTMKSAVKGGRKAGLMTAMGIACGVAVHVAYTLLGLGYVVSAHAWVLDAVRYAGAAYLLWLGASAFFPSARKEAYPQDGRGQGTRGAWAAMRDGFFCNALNPKTVLFFVALFTQVVGPDVPLFTQAGVGVFISLVHLLWFSFVVVAMTNKRTLSLFHRWRGALERVVGSCLLGLGGKLLMDA